MKFSYLEDIHKQWHDVLVIGRTIEHDDKKYHIIGMTAGDDVKLHIIEPYTETENYFSGTKGVRSQRKILREQRERRENEVTYMHCSEFRLGNTMLEVRSGSGGSLKYSTQDYESIQLFLDMLRAGWVLPDWLKDEEWDNLQMDTLVIDSLNKLPHYTSDMPITIKHRADFIPHILEKTVTLNVGKSSSFSFVDNYGDKVQCYINNVVLIDMWKEAEEQFNNPKYTEMLSAEQLQEVKELQYKALEQNCPKGMCYIGIEYECSKDINLQFYTKEFLKSVPETHSGSSVFLMMNHKPDKETGTHNLPLKGCVIQTAVPPDTSKIPAELFLYHEKVPAWEETV